MADTHQYFRRQSDQIKAVTEDIQDILNETNKLVSDFESNPPTIRGASPPPEGVNETTSEASELDDDEPPTVREGERSLSSRPPPRQVFNKIPKGSGSYSYVKPPEEEETITIEPYSKPMSSTEVGRIKPENQKPK